MIKEGVVYEVKKGSKGEDGARICVNRERETWSRDWREERGRDRHQKTSRGTGV